MDDCPFSRNVARAIWLCVGSAFVLALIGICAGCDQATPPGNHATPATSATGEVPQNKPSQPPQLAGSAEAVETLSPEYRRGYDEGIAQAESEFAHDAATVYVYGLGPRGQTLDLETGLNETAIAGCIVSDFILGRADGHNKRIRELINKHGIPAYSRKKHEGVLFALAQFFSTRAPSEIEILHIGGHDVMLGNGRIRLSQGPDGLRAYVNGVPLTRHGITNEVQTSLDAPLEDVPQKTEATLGPEGSDTVIFRWTFSTNEQRFGALDLRNAKWLRIAKN